MEKYKFQIEPRHSRLHTDPEMSYLSIPTDVFLVAVLGPSYSGKSTVSSLLSRLTGFRVLGATRDATWLTNALEYCRTLRRRSERIGIILDGCPERRELTRLVRFLRVRPECIWVTAPPKCRQLRAKAITGLKPSMQDIQEGNATAEARRDGLRSCFTYGEKSLTNRWFLEIDGNRVPEQADESLKRHFSFYSKRRRDGGAHS